MARSISYTKDQYELAKILVCSLNWTQQKAANALGLKRETVAYILSGKLKGEPPSSNDEVAIKIIAKAMQRADIKSRINLADSLRQAADEIEQLQPKIP